MAVAPLQEVSQVAVKAAGERGEQKLSQRQGQLKKSLRGCIIIFTSLSDCFPSFPSSSPST